MTPQHISPAGQAAPAPAGWRWLRTGVLVWLVVLPCALLVAGIWLVTLQRIAAEREQAVAAALKANGNLAIAFEQQVFRTLKAAEQVAIFVREQYQRQGSAIDLGQWAARGVIRESMFTIVSVVDASGAVVVSSRKIAGPVNYADRAFFRVQQGSREDVLFVSGPVLGRISGRWRVPMSLRITRADGGFGGVVVLSVDPAHFTDFYREADLGARGLLELSGLDGVVRGRKIGAADTFGAQARGLAWPAADGPVAEGGRVDDGAALDGVERVMSYRAVTGYPLVVSVGTALDDVLAPVRQRRAAYLAMTAGGTAVVALLAALLVAALLRRQAAAAALGASEALFRATFDQAAVGIVHVAPDGRILRANGKFRSLLGYGADELAQRSVFDLAGSDGERDSARAFLARALGHQAGDGALEMEKTYQRKDGSLLWVNEALGVVRGRRGQARLVVAVLQDITERKELEERLSRAALHDALTGLANRVMFQDRLHHALESARRRNWQVGVLYLDLDGFKEVNDTLGHAAGDALLQQVARRLEDCVRAEDTVARFGGDEFAVVLTAVREAQDCERVARKLVHMLAQPYGLQGEEAHLSASVGLALYPAHGADMDTLIMQADNAMYAAKRQGRNGYCWAPDSGAGQDFSPAI